MSATLSIRDVAAPLLSKAPEIAAVLFAYLDESGLNPTARATVVGGLIGPINQWVAFEAEWRAALPAPITVFHTRDCQRGIKDYARMTEAERMALYDKLAMISAHYQFIAVAGSIINADWLSAKTDDGFRERYPSAYSFCFELCLLDIRRVAQAARQNVMVIYGFSDAYANRAAFVGHAYEQSQRFAACISSCSANRPENVVPLQAADMLCYEIYHQYQSEKHGKGPVPRLLPLLPQSTVGFYHNRRAIENAVKRGPLGFID